MHGRAQEDEFLTALECSERIGISIRALRLYEQHGLISPRRTFKQWRLYGSNEIARLSEIMALKSLGLSLRDISKLLRGHHADLARILALQRDALADARKRAERGLQVIEALQSKIRSGATASIDDLTNLAKETNMAEPLKDTVAWRRYEQMRPRTEIAAKTRLYDDYAGAYGTDDGTFFIVSRRDSQLFYRVVGQPDIEIFPEGDAEFFMKMLPVQVTFQREDGQVRGLIHHQNGFEDHAGKMDPEPVRLIDDELQRRIREHTPVPDSEAILRRVIEEHMRGEPDLDGMVPALAEAALEQKDFIRSELDQAGELKALSFKGVSQGLDVYDVQFANAKMEWGFSLTRRGKIAALYLRPAL
ncbi:MerR family transcriptional regulator [Mesorhizobium sp. PAMC28654]|uniref:MerR family transcriptional regulator n=1 Tax=Mesorhizobium sp. PAMC28654 TaxID=2880934 RepID=UPI001D0A1292|nr:MerR family transcriptional regulator [Mesorhizobium sp. PAMC28654]UDL88992.1 MerR family transcriptional regulator [Mesorhizobium sp. PAMC28654]